MLLARERRYTCKLLRKCDVQHEKNAGGLNRLVSRETRKMEMSENCLLFSLISFQFLFSFIDFIKKLNKKRILNAWEKKNLLMMIRRTHKEIKSPYQSLKLRKLLRRIFFSGASVILNVLKFCHKNQSRLKFEK